MGQHFNARGQQTPRLTMAFLRVSHGISVLALPDAICGAVIAGLPFAGALFQRSFIANSRNGMCSTAPLKVE